MTDAKPLRAVLEEAEHELLRRPVLGRRHLAQDLPRLAAALREARDTLHAIVHGDIVVCDTDTRAAVQRAHAWIDDFDGAQGGGA